MGCLDYEGKTAVILNMKVSQAKRFFPIISSFSWVAFLMDGFWYIPDGSLSTF
jgi:hypothetical protein